MQSVRDFHPDADRFIVLADSYRDFAGIDVTATLIFCDDLGVELSANMKLWYSGIEFSAAIKPFVFRHLFDRFRFCLLYTSPSPRDS